MNDGFMTGIMIVVFFVGLALGIVVGIEIGEYNGYKEGQVGYINGEIKYEIREGRIWELKDE